MNVMFDMETADPDDAMTLCFLLSHPRVHLVAVTLTPGSEEQVGLVKRVLDICGYDGFNYIGIRDGGYNNNASCVSTFHHKWLGKIETAKPNGDATTIIHQTISAFPNATLLTGAALTNPCNALTKLGQDYLTESGQKLDHWVAQGGFAGDSVVPPEYRLDKFKGKETCPTFNFNGNPKAAEYLLSTDKIKLRHCVSKNVCHGMYYDHEMHEMVKPHKDKNAALNLIYKGMEIYLAKKPKGKLFHDPLAAASMINPEICQWKEVELYRRHGQWGSKLKDGTNTFISISADRDKFIETLVV
jgi:pyrimidine-specific ribonucleoside hydrolase